MATYQDDFLFSDAAGAPPASPIVVPQTEPQPGIGMAPPQAPAQRQPDLRRDAISRMGMGEKFLSAIGEFGNAVTGRPSPLNAKIVLEQREKTEKLARFKAETDAIEDSVKWVQRLRTPEEKQKFVDVRVGQLNEQKPGLGDQFKTFAAQPDLVTKFRDYESYLSEPVKLLMQTSPDGFMKFAATPEGMKSLQDAHDKSTLRLATKKAQTAIVGWDKFAPPDVVARYKKDGVITASEFMDAQQYVPEAARLSEKELEVASRTPGFWEALNIVGPKDEAAANKKRLEEKDKAESTIGKIKADLKAGRITQAEADAAINKANEPGGINLTVGAPVSGVDAEGNPVFFQPDKKGGKPTIVQGVTPRPTGNPILQEVGKLIAESGKGGDAGKAAPKGAKPGAVPAGIPAGSKVIGKTPEGKDVWQSPNGKKWVP